MPTSLIDLQNSQVNLLSQQGQDTFQQELTRVIVPVTPTISGYEVLEEIGRGGMGVVYKARDPELKRLVAIKMLLDPEFASAEQRMRFKIEAEAVAQLRHPNIVQVFELGELAVNHAHPYMVLEFIEGPTLFRYLRQHSFSERESAALLMTLARAVQHAHDHGLIHRDLKPANILLQNEVPAESGTMELHRLLEYVPKITDFGLVKALTFEGDHQRDLTRPELMVGTPQYMAPEQANPAAQATSCSVDIYSLGVILYELLTGQLPHDDKDILKMLMDVQTKEPVSPRKLQAKLSLDLETICLKCLQKEPQYRYHSAAALADDLARYLNREPIQARPLSEWQRMVKWVQRYPTVASLVGVLFSVITSALVVIGFLWHQADADRQHAEDQSHQAELARDIARASEKSARSAEQSAKESEQASWVSVYFSRISQADLLLHQGQLIRSNLLLNSILATRHERGDPRSWEWYYLRRLCMPMDSIINSPADYVRQVAFHPRQDCIFCIESPEVFADKKPADFKSRLMRFQKDQKEWKSRVIYDSPLPLRQMQLALGGEKVVLGDMDGNVVVVDTKPTQAVQLISDVVQLPSHHSWHVASEAGLVVLWQKSVNQLELYDLREERVNRKIPLPAEPVHAQISDDGQRIAYLLKNGTVGVWDAAKQQALWEQQLAAGRWNLKLSTQGNRVALLHEDGNWKWLDAQTGRRLHVGKHQPNFDLQVSPDGSRLAVLTAGQTGSEVQVWRADEAGTVDPLPLILQGHRGKINGLVFHSSGMQLLTLGADSSLRLWDTSNHPNKAGSVVHEYRGHYGNVLAAAFDPRSDLLVSGGLDANLMIWDTQRSIANDQLHINLGCGGEWISDYQFIAGTRLLAIFEHQGTTLSHYHLDTRKIVQRYKLEGVNKNFAAPRYDATFSPDGKLLAVCPPLHDQARIYDAQTGKLLWTTTSNPVRIVQMHFSGDGKRLLLAGHLPMPDSATPKPVPFQCNYQVWDIETRKPVIDTVVPAFCTGWAINHDGSRVVALLRHPEKQAAVHAFDVNQGGKQIFRIKSETNWIMSLAFSPDGQWITACTFDPKFNHLFLWRADTGEQVWRQVCLFESTHVRFSNDSRRIFNTGYSSDVIIFDVSTGSEVLTLRSHGAPRTDDYALTPRVVLNDDETLLAVHSWDSGISLWHAIEPKRFNNDPANFRKELLEEAILELNAEFLNKR